METIALAVQDRTSTQTLSAMRKDNTVPCVVYGIGVENTSLQCAHNLLMKAYEKAGENTVVQLEVKGKKMPVLFHAIDFHPVTEKILHVDFYAVNMKEKIQAAIPLNIIGEAPAVKELSGVLFTVIDHVNVESLPADLPHAIDIDVSGLETFEDSIHISDIKVAGDVEILDDPEMVIVNVQAPRAAVEEEETEAAEGEAEVAEGEKAAEGEGEKSE